MNRLASTIAFAIFSLPLAAASFKIDPFHSRMEFRIRNFVFSSVTGKFTKFEGTGAIDEKTWAVSNAKVEIDVSSIDTGDSERDRHLLSADFFDVAKYPKMTFEVLRVVSSGEGAARTATGIVGKLTIKNVTKEITLALGSAGVVDDKRGNVNIAFDGTATINRQEFGLNWNKEGYDPIKKIAIMMVADTVTLDIGVSARKVEAKNQK